MNAYMLIILILLIWNFIIIITKRKRYKKNIKKGVEVFNLGSSHSYFAFNYEMIENRACENLANPSQTLYYDYKILNHFFNKLSNNGKCFLTISYFSFGGRERWLKEDLVTYFKILKLKDFSTLDEKINYIIFNYFPMIWSIKKKYSKLKNKNKVNEKDRILGHKNILAENRNLEYNFNILEKIILKCKEKNIKVVLVTTPFTHHYNSYFNEGLLEKNFYKIMNKIIQDYKLEYINLSHDYFNFTEKEFDDYDHLSKKGSIKFMNYLIKNKWI